MIGPLYTVLQVVPEMSAGGVERTTIDIARALRNTGGRAIVATKGGRLEDELRAAGAEIVLGDYASKNPLTLYRNAGVLARIVRAERVDIVHARSRAPAWSAKWAAERTGAKFVTTYAGIYNARSPFKRWYNSVMASGDVTIANSAFTARHIRETYPALRKPIAVIPRGIDLSRFDPAAIAPANVAAMRQRWAVPEGRKVVLMPGRLTRWKGGIVFAEAMAAIRDLGAHGVLAGDAQSRNSFETELRAHIASLGADSFVHVTGHEPDMPTAYAASDVVVSASLEPEAFGRVAVEAQAMRRLIVATNLGAARETVLPDQSGWLIPADDSGAMGQAIAEALTLDPFAVEAMRDRGRAHVMARFDVLAMCRDTMRVYTDLVGQPRQRALAAE